MFSTNGNASLLESIRSSGPSDDSVQGLAGDAGAVRALLALAVASERLLRSSGPSPDLEAAMAHLGESLDYRAVAVWRHNNEAPGTYDLHARWQVDSWPSPDKLDVRLFGLLPAHNALRRGETVAIRRVDATGDQVRLFAFFPDEAMLMVPIMGTDQSWGAAIFAVPTGGPSEWSVQELACLRTVAAVVGGAVRREEARRRTEALERALLESQHRQQMSTLAVGVAHDVNNLLGVMQAGVDVIELHGGKAGPQDLKRIEDAIGAATAMVDKLYAYAGMAQRQAANVDMYHLLRHTLRMLRDQLPAEVHMVEHFGPGLPEPHGDPTQLAQIISNLVLNARDALQSHGGTITVAAHAQRRDDHHGVTVSVSDDGRGIDESVKDKVFQPFVSTKGPGRGIGLANAHAIVAAHHGVIAAHNLPNGGASFTLWLPAEYSEE